MAESMSAGLSLEAVLAEQDELETGGLLSGRTLFARRRPRWVAIIGTTLALALVAVPFAGGAQNTLSATGQVVRAVEVKDPEQDEKVHRGNHSKDEKPEKEGQDEKDEKEPDMGMGFPQKMEGGPWPSLFCWSVMNCENQAEVDTIKGQLRKRIGIFACDNVAVLSGRRMRIGEGHEFRNGSRVQVYSWLNPAHAVPMGNLQGGDHTNSFKNTDIFIGAWNILVKSGVVFTRDWTMKVDPDAVFFPHRMRWHVKAYSKEGDYTPYYFKNCDYNGPQLYGSLEVFNKAALQKYKDQLFTNQCQNLPWGGWGEDEWIDKCMQSIGAVAQIDYKLVGDHRCMSAECYATDRVAFHDYKTWDLYETCHNHSVDAEKIKDGGYFCCTFGTNPADPCNSCAPSSKQWPGTGYCGGSKYACEKCGQSSTWCRMTAKDHAEKA